MGRGTKPLVAAPLAADA